jgi:hypothetical protein
MRMFADCPFTANAINSIDSGINARAFRNEDFAVIAFLKVLEIRFICVRV